MEAKSAGYVYSELRVVDSCQDDANDPSIGCHTVVMRWMFQNKGSATPIVVSLRECVQLHADLERIFKEYEKETGNTVPRIEDLDE